MAETVKLNIESNSNALETTRKRIEAIKGAMLETEDVDTFNKLALEAGALETEIRRTEDAVTSLAGSGSELTKMSTSLNQVGSSLMSLDFESAAESAGRMAKIGRTMSFGSAVKSLKALGSTFMSLGKAILTNPLFLIAGVVVAIIAGIVALMDELGILKVIFEAVGDAIDWVIQKLKDFLDWLGLTNYAEEDAAQRSADAAKKRADAQEKASNSITQGLDNEIAMIKAKGEVNDKDFAKIQALEAKKREELDKIAQARMEEAQAALDAAVLKGDLDEEELQALRDTLDEKKLAWEQTQANIAIGHQQAITDRIAREDAAAREEQKSIDETAAKDQEKLEKRQAAYEKYKQNRLNAERQVQDLVLEIMEEGTDKELAEINTKYDRLIEDTKANEDLLESEKTAIVEKYEKLRAQKVKEVNENNREEEIQRELDFQNRLKSLKLSNMEDGFEKEKEIINNAYQQERQAILANEELTEQQKTQLLTQKKIERGAKLKKIDDEIKEKNKEAQQAVRDLEIQNMQEGLDKELAMINNKYDAELAAAKDNAELIKQIEISKEKEINKAKEAADKEREAMQKATVEGSINAANGLLDAIIANTEEGSKAQENALVAQAIMQGAMGAVGAVSQSISQLGPIAGPIVGGVLAAGIVATTAANIKNIKSARKGGGSSGGGSNLSTPSASASTRPEETPSVNLFGQGTGGSQGGADMFNANNNNNQPQQIQAVVQWSDIDNVQNQNNNIQNEMQL